MKKTVYLIHGWTGTPSNDWFPWITKQLRNKGFSVVVPAMPDTNNPFCSKWIDHMAITIKKPYSQCYLIGHSLGCIAILRFLESLSTSEKVGGVLLVAGFGYDLEYKDYLHELKSFFDKPIYWGKIRKRTNRFISIHSDNDPWVPLVHSTLFKEKLKADTYIEHNMFHYHQEAGITEVPFVLKQIIRLTDYNNKT